MRIVFMGTPDFAVPSLEALIQNGYEVAGVFTQPDKPKGRGKKLASCPVKDRAMQSGIPVFQPARIRRDGVADLKALKPDLCVTAAFGQILSQEVLDIPVHGTVNVHASLLPRHRGSAPIAWGLMMGEDTAGVTTMMTDKGIDTGDMLLTRKVEVLPGETCGELTTRLARAGAELLIETLRRIEKGNCPRVPQNHELATYEPMLTKEMGRIDWGASAKEIVWKVRGLNPWPCAYTAFPEGVLKIWLAKEAPGDGKAVPGQVIAADEKNGLIVMTGEGAVEILCLQAPGGRRMDAKDYLRGHPVRVGEILLEAQ